MLDKLSSTLKKTTDKIANAVFLDKALVDSITKDLQRALIEADVNIQLVLELTKKIKPLIIKEEGRQVKIKPKIVVTITYQEIQRSPNYSSGFALRFPRFTALRPDRNAEDIATLEEVKKDYEKQKRN